MVQVFSHALGRYVACLFNGRQFVALMTLAHVTSQVVRGGGAKRAAGTLEGRTEMPNCDVTL